MIVPFMANWHQIEQLQLETAVGTMLIQTKLLIERKEAAWLWEAEDRLVSPEHHCYK
jgi:hypothetical protein